MNPIFENKIFSVLIVQVVCAVDIPSKVSRREKNHESVTLYEHLLGAKGLIRKVSHDCYKFVRSCDNRLTRKVSQNSQKRQKCDTLRTSPRGQRTYMKSVTRLAKNAKSVTLFIQFLSRIRLIRKVSQNSVFCHTNRHPCARQSCHTLALTPEGGKRAERVTTLRDGAFSEQTRPKTPTNPRSWRGVELDAGAGQPRSGLKPQGDSHGSRKIPRSHCAVEG
jgi:hypothetical protein